MKQTCQSHHSTSNMSRSALSHALSHRPLSSSSSPIPPPSSFLLFASLAAATVPCLCVSSGFNSRSNFSSSLARFGSEACSFAICPFRAASSASRSVASLSVSASGRASSGLCEGGVCSCFNCSIISSRPLISVGSASSSCVRSWRLS